MPFLLALKLEEKEFSCVETKTNFASNLAKMLRESTIYFCLFDESHFSNTCTLQYVTIECMGINWLCRHRKKVRSSEASVSINSCTELIKAKFSLWLSLKAFKYSLFLQKLRLRYLTGFWTSHCNIMTRLHARFLYILRDEWSYQEYFSSKFWRIRFPTMCHV